MKLIGKFKDRKYDSVRGAHIFRALRLCLLYSPHVSSPLARVASAFVCFFFRIVSGSAVGFNVCVKEYRKSSINPPPLLLSPPLAVRFCNNHPLSSINPLPPRDQREANVNDVSAIFLSVTVTKSVETWSLFPVKA